MSTQYQSAKQLVHIVGAGPAGMMAGYQLLQHGIDVHFYDHKKSAGRKFLVAGKGGFNLSHSKELSLFIENYSHDYIKNAVNTFSNNDTINWLAEIGIPTYIGSSGKIFPKKGIKPIQVLDALTNHLIENGALFHFEYELKDFSENEIIFQHKNEIKTVQSTNVIFALGGGSWKKTGSDGVWQEIFRRKGIIHLPFQSSNAGMICHNWDLLSEGEHLKNCLVIMGDDSKKGEVRFTKYGLEGAPIYALNNKFREGENELFIDLKPNFSVEKIKHILSSRGCNRTQQLVHLKITGGVIQYLKSICSKEEYLNIDRIVELIKRLPFKIEALRPMDEAISTVGGVSMCSVERDFSLKKYPNCYCIGEMLDWDAPTGGYLLQACFSTGFIAAKSIYKK